jgi:hypothetical protein
VIARLVATASDHALVSATSWDSVRARRLACGHLLAPVPREALCDAVCDLGGVQAQVLSAALHAPGCASRG